jgi:hypothetical protein
VYLMRSTTTITNQETVENHGEPEPSNVMVDFFTNHFELEVQIVLKFKVQLCYRSTSMQVGSSGRSRTATFAFVAGH